MPVTKISLALTGKLLGRAFQTIIALCGNFTLELDFVGVLHLNYVYVLHV
jgi:hypothetical protein